jgi:urease accessory protein
VTVHVAELLGHVSGPDFEGRRVVAVPVAWDEATRRRLRRSAADGTDVTIDVAPGSYLADGTVLEDDGERVLAVARSLERALVVRFDLRLSPARLVEQALALGQAFGNQHVPVDVGAGEARIPLTTSEAVARATVEALGLEGAELTVADVALGASRPLTSGHGDHHG